MKRLFVLFAVLTVGVGAMSSIALAGNTGLTATPASTKSFAVSYSATFVRSASGIITETNRVNSAGAQNPWTPSNVWIQFRPTTGGTANPTCDPTGLVTAPFTYVGGTDANITGNSTSGYFLPGVNYNVCVYLVPPVAVSEPIFNLDLTTCSVTIPYTKGIDTVLYGVNGYPETPITHDVTITGGLEGFDGTAPQFWIGYTAQPGYVISNPGASPTHFDFYNGDNLRDC